MFRKINELEAPKTVTWVGDWEPDNKYVKYIKLKNNSLRLLKVSTVVQLQSSTRQCRQLTVFRSISRHH